MYKILLKNKTLKDGQHSIIIRVNANNKSKIITLPFKCFPKDWDESKNKFRRGYPNFHEMNRELLEIETKCQEIHIKLLKNSNLYSVDEFYDEYFRKDVCLGQDLFTFWESEALKFKTRDKISSYKTMVESLNVLKKFSLIYFQSKRPSFEEIDTDFLHSYEKYLFENGNKAGGVHIKMRYVRSVFNKAIEQKIINETVYPFKYYKLSKLKSLPDKRTLNNYEINKLLNFKIENYPQFQYSYYIFLFSILARGINFKDLMLLKKSNIVDDRIQYKRAKTGVFLNIKIEDEMQYILNFFEHKSKMQYLFPLLEKEKYSAENLYKIQKNLIRNYNSDLKKIATTLNIKCNLTSYVARHTYATSLKNQGVPIEYIGESMGHKDVAVTKAYLKDFESHDLDRVIDKGLTIFKKK